MKVDLIGINSAYSHTNLAIHYLYNNSIPEGVNANIKEYNINMLVENVIDDLYKDECDVYVFSCYIWNIEFVIKVASTLKKITDKKIILGGSEVSFNASEYFEKYDFVDYIVAGEGEELTKKLLTCLKNNEEPYITNIFTKNSESYEYQKMHMNFNDVVFPYENMDMSKFDNKIVYYESQRGCPYNCSYCLSELDKRLRFRDVEKVKREIQFFIDHEILLVKFIDRTFNADQKRAKEIIRYILDNSKHTRFHFEVCENLLDDEIIEMFGSAPYDMFQLEIGLQSTNECTISEINRRTDIKKIGENVTKLLKQDNVHIHLDLISGLPYEDFESFRNSFNFAYDLKPHMLQLGFLKVLHGTVMETKTEEYNLKYNSFTPYEIVSNKWISYRELSVLKDMEILVDRYNNSSAFCNSINHFVKKADCPFDFYHDMSRYFRKMGYYDRSISKDDTYEFLYEYLKEDDRKLAASLVSFDYFRYVRIRKLKREFMNDITVMNKEEIFELIKNQEFREKYLKEYKEHSNKETYKKINVLRFDINPLTLKEEDTLIVFKDIREDKVRGGNTYRIIEREDYV